MSENILLTVQNMSKTFGQTRALVDVNFTAHRGEVHGLIGENGSGKSTLSTIIAGTQPGEHGAMVLNGVPDAPHNALEANANGVCMLLQARGTFENISVAANLYVGKEDRFCKNGYLNTNAMFAAARVALDRVGADYIDEHALTETLGFEDQKFIEIARAMDNDPEILIVDETTTALSRVGRERLYHVVRQMRERGKCVIFISHDIDEVKMICDFLTVLRDGHMVATLERKDFNDDTIRQLMIGREISDNFYRTDTVATAKEEVAIRAEHIAYGVLKDISLELHYGEILGLGGLTDCGMHDLGRILFGRLKPDAGRVLLADGSPLTSVNKAIAHGIGYVSKDRDKDALMLNASILDNICAPSLKKLQKFGLITKRREKKFSNEWAAALSVKMQNVNQQVMHLSGGNKQKVSVAKWIGFDADVIIFDCPTRGIDVGVRADIYHLLMELKAQGKAIVMISEELMEIIGMSDRIVMIKDGVISGQFRREDDPTESQLIEYII